MEKFDTTIQQAQEEYHPRADFVDRTMRQLRPRRRAGAKLWGTLVASGLAVAAAALIVLPHLGGGSPALPTTTAPSPAASQPPTAATDNASLTSDLAGISRAMNTANGDQVSADNALNDSQQQITIPTE